MATKHGLRHLGAMIHVTGLLLCACDGSEPGKTRPSCVHATITGHATTAGPVMDSGLPPPWQPVAVKPQPHPELASCSTTPWRGDMQFGDSSDDEVQGLTTDQDSNLYLSGYKRGLAGTRNPGDVDPGGNSLAFVTQLDAQGVERWSCVVDTPGTDSGEAVSVRNNKVYWVGRTDGTLSGFHNLGQFDLFAQVLSTTGSLEQSQQTGDEKPQHPRSVALDPAGNLLIGGYNDRYIVSHTLRANERGTVYKMSSDLAVTGPQAWSYELGDDPARSTFVYAAAVDSRPGTDGVYLVGRRAGGGFVKKLSSDGHDVWERRLTTLSIDPASSVTVSATGDVVVVGSTFLPLGGTARGLQDVFVVSIDKDTGAVKWATNAGTSESDWATSVITDSSGDIYVGGETAGSLVPGHHTTGPDDPDLFVMHFGPDGTLKRVWQRGSAGVEHLAAMAMDGCGNLYVAGYTSGDLLGTGSHHGERDGFLMRVRAEDWSSPGP